MLIKEHTIITPNVRSTSKVFKNAEKSSSNKLRINTNMESQNNAIHPLTNDVVYVENLSHGERDFTEVNNRKRGKRRQTTVIGGSILKHLEAHRMQKDLKPNQKIYVKCFPGAVMSDFADYVKPSQKFSPDLYVIHSGSNHLRSTKTPEQIYRTKILELAKTIKTGNNDHQRDYYQKRSI